MKKKVFTVVLAGVLAVLAFTLPVGAQPTIIQEDINKTAGDLEIPRDTIVEGNVSLNMGDLGVQGVVKGDVATNLGKINIQGDVSGDVSGNMGQITVGGNVAGNVRNDIGDMLIGGNVGGNLDSRLGKIEVRGVVKGNVTLDLGEVIITGQVLGDVNSQGRDVRVDGTVEGDINLTRGTVHLGPGSEVQGTIYVERGLVKPATGAQAGNIQVREELTEIEIDQLFSRDGFIFRGIGERVNINLPRLPLGDYLEHIRDIPYHRGLPRGFPFNLFKAFNFLVFLALSLLVYALFPLNVNRAGEALEGEAGQVILWGLLAALLFVPVMVFLAITVVGIPLIFLLILLGAAAWILGFAGVSQWVGRRVLKNSPSYQDSPYRDIALGAAILGLVGMLPVLGNLVSLAASLLAVGSSLVSRFGTQVGDGS